MVHNALDIADNTLSRREFLNYAWLASIALFAVESVGASLWFAFPNFGAGDFGGVYPLGDASDVIPEPNTDPVPYSDGKFWLVNVDVEVDGQQQKGVLALYKVCTHLGCLYEWRSDETRFECPCHGSRFEITGEYIKGPARRSLDRFKLIAEAPDGSVRVSEKGEPLTVKDGDKISVDTGVRILGSNISVE